MVQNTPTGCGNDLPILLRSHFFRGIIGILLKIDLLHYMGLGRVWYGAKYSHGVWERFAHRFESFDKSKKYTQSLNDLTRFPTLG